MPLPSTAKLLDVIAKLQSLTGITQIPDLKEALQSRGINLTGNETMVDLVQIVKDNNFNNTADATAAAGDVLQDKTAYVKGVKVTGSMPNNGARLITPQSYDQPIPAGYHNGSGKVFGVPVPTQFLVEGNTVANQGGTLKDYSRAKLTADNSVNYFVDAVGFKERVTQNSIIVQPPTGYYDDGVNIGGEGSIRVQDPNFKAENILMGTTVFGAAGTAIPGFHAEWSPSAVPLLTKTGEALTVLIPDIKIGSFAIMVSNTAQGFGLRATVAGAYIVSGDMAEVKMYLRDDVTLANLATVTSFSYTDSNTGQGASYLTWIEIDQVNRRLRVMSYGNNYNPNGWSTYSTNNPVSLVATQKVKVGGQAGIQGGVFAAIDTNAFVIKG